MWIIGGLVLGVILMRLRFFFWVCCSVFGVCMIFTCCLVLLIRWILGMWMRLLMWVVLRFGGCWLNLFGIGISFYVRVVLSTWRGVGMFDQCR